MCFNYFQIAFIITVGSQQGATLEPTIGDMGRSHKVFATIDNRQAKHQAIVIEATGVIQGYKVTILFDSRAKTLLYPLL